MFPLGKTTCVGTPEQQLWHSHHTIHTGCMMKNASTHNFFIYYPISMNKKIKDMDFPALQNSHKIYLFWRYLQ
jgi:hypothetical protein